MKKYLLLSSILFSVVFLNSCKEDEPEPPTNEDELITTVEMSFTSVSDSVTTRYYFRDTDGEGGNAPVQWDTITLDTSKQYVLEIRFLNESNPADVEDVTVEIRAEDDEHLICFDPRPAGLGINYLDSDGTHPLGLLTSIKCNLVVDGSLGVALRHQPDGIKNGSCSVGDTDVEVLFPLRAR